MLNIDKGINFTNKTVVVTGSSRGIGAEIAKSFARYGANVAICYFQNLQKANKVKKELKKISQKSEIFKCDISRISSIKKTIDLIIKEFGSLDVLINNAGVLKQTNFEEIQEKEYDWILDTNLKGTFFFCQYSLPYLLKSHGTIINIASVGGQRGGPKAPHYSASKAAIISLTKSLSNIYAPKGIRVNSISPGQIATEMTKEVFKSKFYKTNLLPKIPLGRVGQPLDVANTAIFLASDLADYITGQTINVNGGEYLS